MFERFTERARAALAVADQEAAGLGHDYLGTEHLLLGLLATFEGRDPVIECPSTYGVDRSQVRVEVVHLVGGNHDESLGETEAKALRTLGIDLDAVREAVEKRFGAGALEQPVGRQVGMRRPFTPRAKKVLELSLHEAVSLDDSFLGREHLLLGLIREEHGVAGQVLAARVDLPTLRADVLSRLGKAA